MTNNHNEKLIAQGHRAAAGMMNQIIDRVWLELSVQMLPKYVDVTAFGLKIKQGVKEHVILTSIVKEMTNLKLQLIFHGGANACKKHEFVWDTVEGIRKQLQQGDTIK